MLAGMLTTRAAAPCLRHAICSQSASFTRVGGSPRCGFVDELKYQLSNADEESRPARDLVENPAAFACALVAALNLLSAALPLRIQRPCARSPAAAVLMPHVGSLDRYLIVLFLLASGLAYLASEDRRIAARQEQSLRELEDAASMLREQGLSTEAAVLDKEIKTQRKPPEPPKPKGLASDPFDDDDGNRFQRRQGSGRKGSSKSGRKGGKKRKR